MTNTWQPIARLGLCFSFDGALQALDQLELEDPPPLPDLALQTAPAAAPGLLARAWLAASHLLHPAGASPAVRLPVLRR